jgi:hypothetical protein
MARRAALAATGAYPLAVISRHAAAAACLLTLLPFGAACRSDVPPVAPHPLTTSVPLDDDARDLQRAREKTPRRIVEGVDYWFVAPRGFHPIPKKDPANRGLRSFWISGTGPTADGIIVWVGPATGSYAGPEKRFRRASIKSLAQEVQEVEVIHRRKQLDGHPVLHLHGISTRGPATVDTVAVRVNDAIYAVKFQLSVYHSAAERDAIINAVIDSWHWGAPD